MGSEHQYPEIASPGRVPTGHSTATTCCPVTWSRPCRASDEPEAASIASPPAGTGSGSSPPKVDASLGTYPTKRAADAAYARSITEQADGKPVPRSAASTPTLAEYAPTWVSDRLTSRGEPLRPRVRDLYDTPLRLHILPTFGSIRLAKITTAGVRAWYSDLVGPAGPGASTAAKCYRLLRSILATPVEDGHLVANPCTIKGAGVERAAERSAPTVEQAHRLAEAIKPRIRILVLLAAFVGLRKGELLGLRRCDIDLERGEITIVQQRQLDRNGNHLVGPPKTEAGTRTIAIPAVLLDALADHLDMFAQPGDDGYIFTGVKGGPLTPHVLQGAWAKARGEVGLPDLHFHDLRHLAGTLAAGTGAGTKEIMYRLGHATHQAALRYQHATHERDRAISASIDGQIRRA